MIQKDYQKLFALSRETATLQSILNLLQWDQETYMPTGGEHCRGEEIQTLSGIIHDRKVSKKFAAALSKLANLKTGKIKRGLNPEEEAAVREWHRDWKRDTALPSSFVKKFARATSAALNGWRKAKKAKDFALFAPHLQTIVDLSREKADYLGWEEHPYDALVNLYEEGVTTREIAKLFNQLKKPLHELIAEIQPVNDEFLHGRFPEKKQLEFGRMILENMGYDFNHGRIDLSAHPFSEQINPDDNRITTRLHPSWIVSNILVLLHEGGHSLYSMGLPKDKFGSPLGEAISMGMHECQSRFWETRIGQSLPFWKHYLPQLQKLFPGKFDVKVEPFYRAVNRVHPSMIRVDADEVTYPLHVILRFEMEKALIDGSLSVADVPAVWNEKMVKLLGICPAHDSEGCMQDIHWAMGGFGYFPSYTLGTIYASHLFQAFERDCPDWDERVSKGELIFIKEWLNTHVYQYGRRYNSLDLLKKVTGKKLTAAAYIEYLTTKYRQKN